MSDENVARFLEVLRRQAAALEAIVKLIEEARDGK